MTQPIYGSSLAQRLRAETSEAHARLESATGFNIHQPDAATAIQMLEDFCRVLLHLEPELFALLPSRLANRAHLDLLKQDLLHLGHPIIQSLHTAPIWTLRSEAQALGALYVLEGSTLGGKIIAKALRRLPDWPLRGVTYFDPYGSNTGAMWASFQRELLAAPEDDGDEIVAGAKKMFSVLEDAMAREPAC